MIGDSQTQDSTGRSRRILVIEDNLDSAEVLQTFLEIHGHRITVRNTALEGLETAREMMPDLIICDISLSGELDGYDIAREIRRTPAVADVFMIALSGYGRPEDKENSRAAGFDEHLTKPTDFDALLALIENLARR